MDRAIPTASKIITKKINDRNRQLHLARLQEVKSSIPKDQPQSFGHLKSNKKKSQIYEEKLGVIERENRILLDKLTSIMKIPKNENGDKKIPKSLNREQRKKELVKITMENYSFLKRLRDKKSQYDKDYWEQERRKNEKYLKNISEFPLNLYTTATKTPKSPIDEAKRPQTFENRSGLIHQRSQGNSFQSKTATVSKHSSEKDLEARKRPIRLEPMDFGPNQKKVPLHESLRKVGFSNFAIHIYLEDGCINILASNKDRPDYKSARFNAKESEKLILKYEDNWGKLVDRIKFDKSRIILDDPVEDPFKKDKIKVESNDVGIMEIQDDNDENESFEASENRAREKYDQGREENENNEAEREGEREVDADGDGEAEAEAEREAQGEGEEEQNNGQEEINPNNYDHNSHEAIEENQENQ